MRFTSLSQHGTIWRTLPLNRVGWGKTPSLSNHIYWGRGGGVTQDVGSGTIGVGKCGKWDYWGKKCGKWDFHFNVELPIFVEIICVFHIKWSC